MKANKFDFRTYAAPGALEGGGAPPPEPSAAPPAEPPAAAQAPAPPSREQIAQFLEANGLAAVPQADVARWQQQQDTQQRQATDTQRNVENEREIQQLAELQMVDPDRYNRLLAERTTREVTNAVRDQVNAQIGDVRQVGSLQQQIMTQVRATVPGLSESDYATVAATVADPRLTAQQLQLALQHGSVVNHAKSLAYDKGLGRGTAPEQRRANEAAPPPTATKADARDGAAEKLAASLSKIGVKLDDIKASPYYKQGAA